MVKVCVTLKTVTTRDVVFVSEEFTGDGAATSFALANKFKSGSVLVFVNGLLARKGVGNTWQEGSDQESVDFTTAPVGGGYADQILVHYAVL